MKLLIEAFQAQQTRLHLFNKTQAYLVWEYIHVADQQTINDMRIARQENAEAIEDLMEHFQRETL